MKFKYIKESRYDDTDEIFYYKVYEDDSFVSLEEDGTWEEWNGGCRFEWELKNWKAEEVTEAEIFLVLV